MNRNEFFSSSDLNNSDLTQKIELYLGKARIALIGLGDPEKIEQDNPFFNSYGMNKNDVATTKSFIDLLMVTVGADGEISKAEISVLLQKLERLKLEQLIGQDGLEEAKKHFTFCLQDENFKQLNFQETLDKHVMNLENLGYLDNALQSTVIAALCDASYVARADGYDEREREAVQNIARMFKIDNLTLEKIETLAEIESKLSKSQITKDDLSKVKELYESFDKNSFRHTKS